SPSPRGKGCLGTGDERLRLRVSNPRPNKSRCQRTTTAVFPRGYQSRTILRTNSHDYERVPEKARKMWEIFSPFSATCETGVHVETHPGRRPPFLRWARAGPRKSRKSVEKVDLPLASARENVLWSSHPFRVTFRTGRGRARSPQRDLLLDKAN